MGSAIDGSNRTGETRITAALWHDHIRYYVPGRIQRTEYRNETRRPGPVAPVRPIRQGSRTAGSGGSLHGLPHDVEIVIGAHSVDRAMQDDVLAGIGRWNHGTLD